MRSPRRLAAHRLGRRCAAAEVRAVVYEAGGARFRRDTVSLADCAYMSVIIITRNHGNFLQFELTAIAARVARGSLSQQP